MCLCKTCGALKPLLANEKKEKPPKPYWGGERTFSWGRNAIINNRPAIDTCTCATRAQWMQYLGTGGERERGEEKKGDGSAVPNGILEQNPAHTNTWQTVPLTVI